MADFSSLLSDVVDEKEKIKKPAKLTVLKTKTAAKPKKGLGCENCELNDKHRHKFITKVRGRNLMLIGTAPSEEDEEEGKLLKSTAGRFLWREFAKVGINRTDCDIQMALRCNPGFDEYVGNKKFKHPIRCCSEHTEKALEESKAKVYVIFGIEAAKQVLGKEYRIGTTILWSEKLNAKVYCLYQPTYFIRSQVPVKALKEFRKNLELVAEDLKRKKLSKYQYIEDQDYQGIITGKAAKKEVATIKRAVVGYAAAHKKPLRVYCDEEAGHIQDPKIWETLCLGTCIKPGRVRVFVTSSLLIKSLKERKKIRLALKDLLEDPTIEKAFHYSVYDRTALKEHLDIDVTNCHFDTNYSSYLYNPDLRSYGLDNVGLHYFPQFGEYKTIILPEALPKDFDYKATRLTKATLTQVHDYITARGMFNLAQLPLEKLVRYNAADCDLGKRLELLTGKKVSLPLLSVYTDVAFVLAAMGPNGPYFDYKQYKKMRAVIPPKVKVLLAKLRKYAGDKNFNPGSPLQVAKLLYDKLKLVPPVQSNKDRRAQKSLRRADKSTLEMLARQHEVPKLLAEYRKLAKMVSTYLDSYSICADNNSGRLRTRWWLCLKKGTLVLTTKGYIPVEDVTIADFVLSHKGKKRKVLDAFYNGHKEVWKVVLDNGQVLETTANHPYLVNGKWVKASQLKEGTVVTTYGSKEQWKKVSEYKNLEVSSWGRARDTETKKNRETKKNEGDRYRLVAKYFIGPKPTNRSVVRHRNGYEWDCTVQNLQYGTRRQNHRDTVLHGACQQSKLTNADIEFIKTTKEPYSSQKLADRFGVSRTTLCRIRHGQIRSVPCAGHEAFVQFGFSKVVSVAKVGIAKTYGITIHKDASHVTNGIVTHNTGTRTGRLSSGGGKAKDLTATVVNLQNVHGDPDLQNMLVPDPKWRKLYVAVKVAVGTVLGEFELAKLKKLALDSSTKKDYEAFAEGCYTKLSKSLKFKRLCAKIVAKYGNIRIVLGFDQGQVEVRVMAQASGDKNLIADCIAGDIHSKVGHRMTGWPVEKIKHDKKTRTLTKNIHFGILFGLGADGLMSFILHKDPDSTLTEAKAIELWENYFKAYPGVRRFIEKMRKFVEANGYVENMFGFRRPLSNNEKYSESDEEHGGAYILNQAINTPIQGAAHQLMLMAMTRLKDKASKFHKILGTPGMEVHDAIYWWTKLKDLPKASVAAKQLLEEEPLKIVKELYPDIDWKIPLVVEGKAGFRLGDSVEIEEHGTLLQLHDVLAKMFLSTFKTDSALNEQVRMVA